MILLRATQADDRFRAFAAELRNASGMDVVAVLDERRGPTAPAYEDKIGLTDALCESLGLKRPKDYTWRCGDYGYYAARLRYPAQSFFWMIEYDVRIRRAPEFFSRLSDDSTDLLAVDLRPADEHWYWYDYQASRDARAWRCLFPVTRLSAKAIDLLLETRRRHGRHVSRRLRWANDEGFVATTVAAAGLSMADLNTRAPDTWTEQSFSFETPLRGEDLKLDDSGPQLLHPVLFGAAFERKLKALSVRPEITLQGRAIRKSLKILNGRLDWLG